MIYFWLRAIKVLIKKPFQEPINFENGFENTFRVGLFDCDGLRIMSAFKYANYVEYNRWEYTVRSPLFKEIFENNFSAATASQKIIFKKPIKILTKFKVKIETVGWDEKWIYTVQTFRQNDEVKAICISRSLVWHKDKPQNIGDLLAKIGIIESIRIPPDWVLGIFENDSRILKNAI